jgi:hypothetical protein
MRSGQQLTFVWDEKRKPERQRKGAAVTELADVPLPAHPRAEEVAGKSTPRQKRTRKSPATLPVPTPLPEAIGKGNFGEDEHGPIRPKPDEVRAITENQAEKLIEILSELKAVEAELTGGGGTNRKALVQAKDKWLCAYQGGIAMYAEDFGEVAANRLDAYVRHELGKRTRP